MIVDNLMSLANEKSSESRRTLLREVTEYFLAEAGQRKDKEKNLFEEIVLSTTRHLDLDARTRFAARIADSVDTPRAVAKWLAVDTIEVARPILRLSPVLTDEDLVEIADRFDFEYMVAIGQRSALDPVVTDVLVLRGNDIVHNTIAGNAGAKFSHFGLGRLVGAAQQDNNLLRHLFNRPDLPTDLAEDLNAIMADRMTGLLETDDPESAEPEILGLPVYRSAASAGKRRDIIDIVHDLRSGATTIDNEVMMLTGLDRALDLATVLQALTGVPYYTAMKALTGPAVEPIFILCRSLDVSWSAFEMVLRLRARRRRQANDQSAAVEQSYRSMPRETAQRVLRFVLIRLACEQVSTVRLN